MGLLSLIKGFFNNDDEDEQPKQNATVSGGSVAQMPTDTSLLQIPKGTFDVKKSWDDLSQQEKDNLINRNISEGKLSSIEVGQIDKGGDQRNLLIERQNRTVDAALEKEKSGELDKIQNDPTTAKDEKARATLAAGADAFGKPIVNAFGYTLGKTWGGVKSFLGIDNKEEREREIGQRLYDEEQHQAELEDKVNNDKSMADKASFSAKQKMYDSLSLQFKPQIEEVKGLQEQANNLSQQGAKTTDERVKLGQQITPQDMEYTKLKKSLQAKYQGLEPLIAAENEVMKAGKKVQGNELKDNLYVEDVFNGNDKLTDNYFNAVRKPLYFSGDEIAANDDRTSNIQTASLQFENTLLSQEKARAQKMVEAGTIDSPEDYLGSNEFITYMKGNVATYKNALEAHYDQVKNEQGGVEIIDGSKLRELYKTVPAFQGVFQGVNTYDTEKNSQISALGASNAKQEGGLGGNAKAFGYFSEFVFNEWNKEIRGGFAYNAGDAAPSSPLLKDKLTNQDTFLDNIAGNIAEHPAEVLYFGVTAPMAFGKISTFERLGFANPKLRIAAGILDENLVSLPLDLGTNKTGSDWATSIILNSLGGSFKIGNSLGDTDKIADLVSKESDLTKRKEIFTNLTKLTNVPVDLAGSKEEIVKNLNTFRDFYKNLGDTEITAATFLQGYKSKLNEMNFDTLTSFQSAVQPFKNNASTKAIAGEAITKIDEIVGKANDEIKAAQANEAMSEAEKAKDIQITKEVATHNAKQYFSSVVDNLSPSQLNAWANRRLSQEFASKFTDGAVEQLFGMMDGKVSRDDILAGIIHSSLDTGRKNAPLAQRLQDLALTMKEPEVYKKIALNRAAVDAVQKAIADVQYSAKSDPEAFSKQIIEAFRKEKPTEAVASEAKVANVGDINVPKIEEPTLADTILKNTEEVKAPVKKATTEADDLADIGKKTKVEVAKVTSTSDIVGEATSLYTNAERIFADIKKQDKWGEVADNVNQRKAFISDFIASKYAVAGDDNKLMTNVVLSVSNDVPKDEYVRSLAKNIGDEAYATTKEDMASQYQKINEIVQNKGKKVLLTPQEDVEISSKLSATTKKFLKGPNSNAAEWVAEGVQNLFDYMKSNDILINASKLDERIKGITQVMGDETSKKIVVGISGNMVETIGRFAKKQTFKPEELVDFQKSMSVMFHEIGHVVSFNLRPELKAKVAQGLRGAIKDGDLLDTKTIKTIVGEDVYARKAEKYETLFAKDKKNMTELIEEVYADKFERDLYDAVFDFETYERRAGTAFGQLTVDVEEGGQVLAQRISTADYAAFKDVHTFTDRIILQLKALVNDLLGLSIDSSASINKKNAEDMLSLLNYSVIKGDVADIMGGVSKDAPLGKFFDQEYDWKDAIHAFQGNTADEMKTMSMMRQSLYRMAEGLQKGDMEGFLLDGTFLKKTGSDIIAKIFPMEGLTEGQIKLLEDFLTTSKRTADENMIRSSALINETLYNTTNRTLSTISGDGFKLNDILDSLPVRISEGAKSRNAGGIVSDARLTLVKYAMQSDSVSNAKWYESFLNTYMRDKFSNAIYQGFVKQFMDVVQIPLKEDMSNIGEGIMALYNETKTRLLKNMTNPDDIRFAEDVLNPILYLPHEYLQMLGNKALLGKKTVEGNDIFDYVLSFLVKRRQRTGQFVGDLGSVVISNTDDVLSGFGKGFALRNAVVEDLSQSLGKFMNENKLDIALNENDYYEYMYKNIGYFVNNNMTTSQTLISNAANELRGFMEVFSDGDNAEALAAINAFVKNPTEETLATVEKMLPAGMNSDKDVQRLFEGIRSQMNTADAIDPISLQRYFVDKIVDSEMYQAEKLRLSDAEKDIDEITSEINARREFVDEYQRERANNTTLIDQQLIEESLQQGQKQTLKTAEVLGITKERADDILKKGSFFTFDQLIGEKGINDEKLFLAMMTDLVNGKESLYSLMEKSDEFRTIFKRSADIAGSNLNDVEKTIITSDGQIKNIYDEGRDAWYNLFAKMSTASALWKDDPEMQETMSLINSIGEKGVVRAPKVNVQKVLKNVKGRDVNIKLYLNGARSTYKNVTKGLSSEQVNQVFQTVLRGQRSVEAEPVALAEMRKFFVNYFSDIEDFRVTNNLGSIYKETLEPGKNRASIGIDSQLFDVFGGIGNNSNKSIIINRLTGLWNYVDTAGIGRIQEKYKFMRNFYEDVLFRAAHDVEFRIFGRKFGTGASSSKVVEAAQTTGKILQNVASSQLFGLVSAPFKAFQQYFNNIVEARGMLAAVGSYDQKVVKELEELVNDSLNFQIMKTTGKNDEKFGTSKLSFVGSLFENALSLGDLASKRYVVRASIVNALYDDYKLVGSEGIKTFAAKTEEMLAWMSKAGMKDSTMMNPASFDRAIERYIAAETANKPRGQADMIRAVINAEGDKYRGYYQGTYRHFIGKTRANLSAFFVTDNIPELARINVVQNNKIAFGLMKWGVGKVGQYGLELRQAFKQYAKTPEGVMQMLTEAPVFRKIFKMAHDGLKAGWIMERTTDGGFDRTSVMLVLVPFFAATMMTLGDALYEEGYQKGYKTQRDLGSDYSDAMATALRKVSTDLAGRFFVYESIFSNLIEKPIGTYNAVSEDSQGNTVADKRDDAFWAASKALLRSMITNGYNKYSTSSIQGVRRRTDMDGTDTTNLLEYILNTPGQLRKLQNRLTDSSYDVAQAGERDDQVSLLEKFGSMIPALKIFVKKRFSPDYGVLMNNLDDYVRENKLDVIFDPYAKKSDLQKIYSTIEKGYVLNDKDYLKKDPNGVLKSIPEGTDEWYQKAAQLGLINKDTRTFSLITNGLAYEGKTGKELSQGWYEALPQTQKQELTDIYNQLGDAYDKDNSSKGPGKFEQFVWYATKAGYTATTPGLMSAYMAGWDKQVKKNLGIKTGDIYESGQGETEVSTTHPQYVPYIKARHAEELNLVLNNQELIAGESHLGYDIQTEFMKADADNFPVQMFVTSIADGKSTFSQMNRLLTIEKVSQKQGYPQGLFNVNSFQVQKMGMMLDSMTINEHTMDKAKKVVEGIVDFVDKAHTANIANAGSAEQVAIQNIGLATALLPSVDKMRTIDPSSPKRMFDIIGGPAVVGMADILTNGAPATLRTAFELVSNDNAHGGSGKGKGGSSVKTEKVDVAKNKENAIKLLDNYNKVARFAAKYRPQGDDLLPKFEYGYDRGTGSIIAHEIKVEPVLRDSVAKADAPGLPKGTGGGLSVARVSVARGKISSGKSSPRAIAGSKVYSRKAGSKGFFTG